ncbi:MAG: polysaccharide biosynthesis protein [Clostridia bacterium]|nr:polysaccharide biosynthesis protein [Clostridia bacterium]
MNETKVKNKKQSFMAGVMTIMFAQIVIKVLGLLYRLVITNIPYFGDEGNGLYGAGFQIYMLILSIATTGVPGAIAKLVSERIAVGKNKEAHHIFKIAFVLFAIIGLIGTSILYLGAEIIASNWIGNPAVEGVLKALAPSIVFVAISAVIRGYFNGMYNMKATSNSQMLEQLFKSLLTIGFVWGIYQVFTIQPASLANIFSITEDTVTQVMATVANLASTVAAAIGFVYLYAFYAKRKKEIWKNINESKVEYKPESIKRTIKTILALSIPMSLASIVSAINRNVDTLTVINGLTDMLMAQGTMAYDLVIKEATRLYGILSGKVDMLIGLPLSINIAFATALVPAVSEALAKKDTKTATRRISFSLRTSMLIALPCSIGMCILAEPILHLLFPNEIAVEAPLLLQISAFTIMFSVLNQTINGALQGIGKIFIPAMSLGIGAITKLVLNLVLIRIPEIGINGAAIGSVCCHLVATCIGFTILRKNIKLETNFIQFILKPLAATGIMALMTVLSENILIKFIDSSRVVTLLAIAIAIISYFLAVIKLKIFEREDYHMLPFGDKIYKILEKIKLVKA